MAAAVLPQDGMRKEKEEQAEMMMMRMILPESDGVAAGTATYCYNPSYSRCLRSGCCSANNKHRNTNNDYDDDDDGGDNNNNREGCHYHHHHRQEQVAHGINGRASTRSTVASSSSSLSSSCQTTRRKGLLGSLSMFLFAFLLVFSQNAQECSSEVVRLRHPDHLYYGDRGGGGGLGPPVILHRHSKKFQENKEDGEQYFRRGDGALIMEHNNNNAGVVVDNTFDEDDDVEVVESLLGGHTFPSSSQQQQQLRAHTSSAFSAAAANSNNNNNGINLSKRKSHNDNNNYNSNNNFDSSSNNRNISEDSKGFNSGSNSGGYNSNSNNNIFNKNINTHQQGHHHHQDDQLDEPAALADIEPPVYFARQGNDEPLEIDQPHVDVSGTSPKGPSSSHGVGSDLPSSQALVSETTPAAGSEAPPVEEEGKLFPPDLFTLEQRRQGAVVFYIMGVMYMFVALAIVCDEFFVPSLDVIIEFLKIEDDVAGATFMAAGGSAPELFTSVIGVFISKDDVGIGTIVGSAVFNILFVIGMCAIFSKTVLHLTWWPLFRDCSFYSIALIILIIFFQDQQIQWWEALCLFCVYICYVTFMKFNQPIERTLKKLLFKNRVTRVSSTDQLVNNKSVNNGASSSQTSVQTVSGNQSSRGSATLKPPLSSSGRRNSIPMLHSGSKFRHGLLQLMIQSIDPLHDGRVDEKATQLHAIASLKALLDAAKTEADTTVTNNSRSKPVSPPQVPASVQPSDAPLTTVDIEDQQANGDAPTAQELAALAEAEDEGHEPLDISWPSGNCKKQISYIILFPIMICLFLTLPDTRTPRGKKFFAWGFLGSILWIAVFSYFMVWWADRTGETFGIAPEIMGLTFLAAGTSIPDLITSVIVARKGLGDMAVSSSVGSNIFDVCVGLPIPWLLYSLAKGEPVEVSAKGMLCSISILFGMLCFVVISIMLFRWKMNKGLGLVMFILYFIFLGVSLLFEYNVIKCPSFVEM